MRTPTLQYLYLQKPVSMIIVICIISVLPWLGLHELDMPAQSECAIAANTMLQTGEWILPHVSGGEVSYDHPMLHWLIVLFSYGQGYVSKLTLQLPGALAFIVMMATSLIFFGRRTKFHEAFISTLFLITCSGMQNLSAASSGDLLFATFLFVSLTQLYRWEENYELKGIPVEISLLLSGAILTKGLMGVILPLLAFTTYLFILRKHPVWFILKAMSYLFVSSLFLPALWYVSIWKQGGTELLLDVMRTEFSYFWGVGPDVHNFLYVFPALAIGFLPWIVFFFFSLFGMKWEKHTVCCTGVKLFSLVSMVVLLAAYAIMPVKRASFLLPIYPFITIFLAQYALYITEYRTWCTRLFAIFMTVAVVCGLLLAIFPSGWSPFHAFAIDLRTGLLLGFTFAMLGTVYYQLFKRINIKILYATIALAFSVNLLVNAAEMI